jgi:UDP-glucose 4-epimerase
MKCKYLVTGGLGFIGNELVRQLNGSSVAILDNRNRVAPRIDDLDHVPVHEVDLTMQPLVAKIIAELKPEIVFHLAAIHYIPECNANPERTMRANVEATLGLLRACSTAGVKHFLLASSGAVYADSPRALDEGAPVSPVDIYGWSKLHAEQLCAWHAAMDGLTVTICRFFNNYGPRETNAHIIPEIISQLRNGDDLHLGNISPRRDYIHTSDTARALRALAEEATRPGITRIVNIASGEHASVSELIQLMQELLGRKLEVIRDEKRFRKADKEVQVADVSLLRSLTGWRPQIGFRDGMRDLLQFEGLL